MVKKYKSIGCQVSVGVFVRGKYRVIEFHPVSNYIAGRGGSEFDTDDEDVQNALEKSVDFGRIFCLVNSNGELVDHIEETAESVADKAEDETKLEVIKVASIPDAKLWLIDNKGWEPKGKVTKKVIAEVAASYGIVFEVE